MTLESYFTSNILYAPCSTSSLRSIAANDSIYYCIVLDAGAAQRLAGLADAGTKIGRQIRVDKGHVGFVRQFVKRFVKCVHTPAA